MDFLEPIKVKEYGGQPVTIAQTKFDGYYTEVYKDNQFGIVICTKKQKENLWPKLKLNPNIKQQVESLPDKTILRCELHAFDVQATSVPTLINDADKRLLLSPFRVELWAGKLLDLTFEEQYFMMTKRFVVPQVNRLTSEPEAVSDSEVENLKQLAIASGIEGWVLKDHPLGNSWKIKPQLTVDAFVVSYTVSDSLTYAGGLKAVQIAVYSGHEKVVIASVGMGFKADYRMSVDMKSLIGRVGEFSYQSVAAKGRLKFPGFLRWRDDEKSKNECLENQLKGF